MKYLVQQWYLKIVNLKYVNSSLRQDLIHCGLRTAPLQMLYSLLSYRTEILKWLYCEENVFWKSISSSAIFLSWWFPVVQTLLCPWFMVLDIAYCSERVRVYFTEIRGCKNYFRIRIKNCTYTLPCIAQQNISPMRQLRLMGTEG